MSKSSGKRSYSMLQKKMNEVEKSKRPVNQTPVNKNSISSNSAKNEDAKEKERKKSIQPASEKKGKKEEAVFDPNVPDRSYGDYFCSICDSHMNSDAMWEAHVTGKRHMKNVKKGDTDSKYDDLNVESHIKEEICNVKEPVVGLQYIHEIRRREPGVPPMYNCFLCHASIATIPLVIEHVISLKHRMNFVKENSPDAYAIMDAVNLRKGQLEPLLLEECGKLEEKMGRGTVKVKQEKPKMVVTPYKRSHDKSDDDDDNYEEGGHRRSSKGSRTEARPIEFQPGPSSWRSIDIPKTVPYQDDYGWRSQEKDMDRTYYPREYSPVTDRERSHFNRETYSPERDTSRRSYSRLSDEYARRSPDKFTRRSPDKFSRQSRSPDKFARRSRSPDKFARRSRSPDKFARRSPDKFSRRSPDKFARHSDSYSRSIYSLSPERDSVPYSCAERPRNDYFPSSPKCSEARPYRSEDMYKNSSSYEKTREVKEAELSLKGSGIHTEVMESLINMTTESFLKMTLLKLRGLQLNGINELHLLTEIITVAKTVLCTHLPADLQANLKEKVAKSAKDNLASSSVPKENAPSPAPNATAKVQPVPLQNGLGSAVQYPNPLHSAVQYPNPLPKNAVSQINDLIFGARKASDLNSRSNLQTESTNYSNNSMSSTVQPNFSNISPVAPTSSNYVPGVGPAPYNPVSYNPASYNPAPYNSNQSTASSGIPGLTLTESENSQQQSHNDYPPSHSWTGSYQRNQDYSAYRRF